MGSNRPCCGEARRAVSVGTPSARATVRQASPDVSSSVEFEYVGATALTVDGPLTGRTYRFAEKGARLPVDGRDAFGLATVPVLRRIRD
ncbi:MAG: hypothetical protein NT029_11670 [Armatimonadetes bacterium]|nr:hypothetical protein [Armatimonadota bacterium]